MRQEDMTDSFALHESVILKWQNTPIRSVDRDGIDPLREDIF